MLSSFWKHHCTETQIIYPERNSHVLAALYNREIISNVIKQHKEKTKTKFMTKSDEAVAGQKKQIKLREVRKKYRFTKKNRLIWTRLCFICCRFWILHFLFLFLYLCFYCKFSVKHLKVLQLVFIYSIVTLHFLFKWCLISFFPQK